MEAWTELISSAKFEANVLLRLVDRAFASSCLTGILGLGWLKKRSDWTPAEELECSCWDLSIEWFLGSCRPEVHSSAYRAPQAVLMYRTVAARTGAEKALACIMLLRIAFSDFRMRLL